MKMLPYDLVVDTPIGQARSALVFDSVDSARSYGYILYYTASSYYVMIRPGAVGARRWAFVLRS